MSNSINSKKIMRELRDLGYDVYLGSNPYLFNKEVIYIDMLNTVKGLLTGDYGENQYKYNLLIDDERVEMYSHMDIEDVERYIFEELLFYLRNKKDNVIVLY